MKSMVAGETAEILN